MKKRILVILLIISVVSNIVTFSKYMELDRVTIEMEKQTVQLADFIYQLYILNPDIVVPEDELFD